MRSSNTSSDPTNSVRVSPPGGVPVACGFTAAVVPTRAAPATWGTSATAAATDSQREGRIAITLCLKDREHAECEGPVVVTVARQVRVVVFVAHLTLDRQIVRQAERMVEADLPLLVPTSPIGRAHVRTPVTNAHHLS